MRRNFPKAVLLHLRIAFLCCVPLLFPSEGLSREVREPKIRVEQNILVFDGDISGRSIGVVTGLIEARRTYSPIRSLLIRSQGGGDVMGMMLGKIVLQENLPVTVWGECSSACANWVATMAPKLYVPDGSFVAFHGGTSLLLATKLTDRLKAKGLIGQALTAAIAHEFHRDYEQQALEGELLLKSKGVSPRILYDSALRVAGTSASRLWIYDKDTLKNCYNLNNIEQYPAYFGDNIQIRSGKWLISFQVIRRCPEMREPNFFTVQ